MVSGEQIPRSGPNRVASSQLLCGFDSPWWANKPAGHKTGSTMRKSRPGFRPMDFPPSVHGMSSTVITSYADEPTSPSRTAHERKSAAVGGGRGERKIEEKHRGAKNTQRRRGERKDFRMQILFRFFSTGRTYRLPSPPIQPLTTSPRFFVPSSQPFFPRSFFCPSDLPVPLTPAPFRTIPLDPLRVVEQTELSRTLFFFEPSRDRGFNPFGVTDECARRGRIELSCQYSGIC